MKNITTIKCPNCNIDIDVNEILYHQLEGELKQKNIATQRKLEEQENKYKNALDDLRNKEELVLVQKEKIDDEIKRETSKHVRLEKQKLYDDIKKQLENEQSGQLALLQNELNEKSEQVKELNKNKAEIEILKREKFEIENKVKAEVAKEFNQQLEKELAKKDIEILELQKIRQEIDKLKEEQVGIEKKAQEKFERQFEDKLKFQKKDLEKAIKEKLENEQGQQLEVLKNELSEKSEKVKELYRSKAEIEKLKREKTEVEERIKAEAQRELNKKLQIEKYDMQKHIDEQNILKLKEKDEKIEQMQRKLADAKRISEQGSMQVQGEAQELAIEEWLTSQFKYDKIDEIKKGAFGADCIQIINEVDIQNCGVICYESKNARTWNELWIEKLKQDMLRVKGDIGVLVTQVMPNNMDRMGFYKGIWVCGYEEFRGCSSLLRDGLIRVYKSMLTQENKTDKMSLLYNYLTSSEFSMQFNIIVDGFIKMQEELEKEKRSVQASWKRKQKIIDGVIINTTEIYGSLQGISGNSIGHIKALDLEYLESEITDDSKIYGHAPHEESSINLIKEEQNISKKENFLTISNTTFTKHFIKINETEYKDKHNNLEYTLFKEEGRNIVLKQVT